VDGSEAAIRSLRPVLTHRDGALVTTIDNRFADVQKLLDAQRTGDSFKLYTDLSQGQIKEFASAVDALSEPLSKVAEVVAR
jgi:iron uptake system component EfeO